MHLLGLSLIVALLSQAAPIQNPPDVTFVLAAKGGKSTFRVGEQIDLEFRLSSTTPRRYVIDQLYRGTYRTVRLGSPFTVEPVSGTTDPWLDVPWLISGYGGGVMSTDPQFLSEIPRVSDAILNDWVSFLTPGRYRVTATSRQIDIPSRSNALEIEIVAAEPGWAEAKLREAVAILQAQRANIQAARTLSFLNTEAAAPRLAEFYTRLHSEVYVGQQLQFGLYASPYRKEVLAAMESALESPDVPIDQPWMETMIELATVTATGPRPLPPARIEDPSDPRFKAAVAAEAQYRLDESHYVAQFAPVAKRYFDKLAEVADRKEGQARVVTLQTLTSRPR